MDDRQTKRDWDEALTVGIALAIIVGPLLLALVVAAGLMAGGV